QQYAKNNQEDCLQEAFSNGQLALAIRYSGQVISTALAVTAASYFLTYSPETLVVNLLAWLVFGIVMTMIVALLTALAKRIVLWGINLVEEVDQQHNIGVASIEMATSIAIALILTALMA
ncbi:MAG: low temperature requirement protein LtrA, partial [Colwellia sp.]